MPPDILDAETRQALEWAEGPHNQNYRVDCGDRLVILARALRRALLNLESLTESAAAWKETAEELREITDQFDWDEGECTHGIIGNYFTCNGSEKGCERSRFLHCCFHMKSDYRLRTRVAELEKQIAERK